MSAVGSSVVQFLYANAVSTLWSNVHADNGLLFKTVRMTPNDGRVGALQLPYVTVDLPTPNRRYHLFELGKVSPAEFNNVGLWKRGWVPLDRMMIDDQMMVIPMVGGRILRTNKCYIKELDSANVVVAVDILDNDHILDNTSTLHVRFYQGLNFTPGPNELTTGEYIVNTSSIVDYIAFSNQYNLLAGTFDPMVYLNGLLLPNGLPSNGTMVDGDSLVYVVDRTITRVSSVPLADLPTYTSTLDSVNKLIYSVDGPSDNIFTDDIDFYVTGIRPSDGKRVGTYLPRYQRRDIRMLTYKDWTISTALLYAALDELNAMSDTGGVVSNVMIYGYHRENGEVKNTVLDANRLPDLLSLTTNYRHRALAGIDATMPIWNANNLETAPGNVWTRSEIVDILPNILTGVYSRYGAISAIERVRLGTNGQWTLPSSAGNDGGELIMYDANGINPTSVTIPVGNNIGLPYPNGRGTELFIPNQGVVTNHDYYTAKFLLGSVSVPDNYGVLCYTVDDAGNKVLAINNVDYSLSELNGQLIVTWLAPAVNLHKYVRSSQNRSIFNQTLLTSEIHLGVDLYPNTTYVHEIGLGTLFVWGNGKYLYEGLDYTVKAGRLYLHKAELWLTANISLYVIYAGLPDSSLTHVVNSTWGFVKYGMMSYNSRYELYLNRNNALFIDGVSVNKADIKTNERFIETVNNPNLIDGTIWGTNPYPQYTGDVALDGITATASQERATDTQIEDYLTNMIYQDTETGLVAIPTRYNLVSTYLDTIINDLVDGTLIAVDNTTPYSVGWLVSYLAAYAHLLPIDPTQANHDLDFIEILPRWSPIRVGLTAVQYAFVSRIIQSILNNQVTGLNLFVDIV